MIVFQGIRCESGAVPAAVISPKLSGTTKPLSARGWEGKPDKRVSQKTDQIRHCSKFREVNNETHLVLTDTRYSLFFILIYEFITVIK